MTRNRKSADRLDAQAMQSQRQADRYREMGETLRQLDPDHHDEIVHGEIARLYSLAHELDVDAADLWSQAHNALVLDLTQTADHDLIDAVERGDYG